MKTKILNELKSTFEPYAPFWDEWKDYKFNGLSISDINIIDIHIENDFTIGSGENIMFYNRIQTLRSLIMKFKNSYEAFQSWVINKFLFAIMDLADDIPFEVYLNTPFTLFDRLREGYNTLSEDHVKTLLKFNCGSLSEIIGKFTEKDFKNRTSFLIIMEFQTILKIERIIYQSLIKEVSSLNRNCSHN